MTSGTGKRRKRLVLGLPRLVATFLAVVSGVMFMAQNSRALSFGAHEGRGPYEVLWEQKHAGTIYFTVGKNLEGADGLKLLVSDHPAAEVAVDGEVCEEVFIPFAEGVRDEKHARNILDDYVYDALKQHVATMYHMEWVYNDPKLFSEFLAQMQKTADDHAHLDHGKLIAEVSSLAGDEERLEELRQQLENHPVHASSKTLKPHTEIEHMLLLFPELLEEESSYKVFLRFYWEHQNHRMKRDKMVECFTHVLLPITFGLGLSSLIVFATSGTVLIPLAIAALACGGTLGGTEIGLAIHKWKHDEKLGRISKRFLEFDKKVEKALAKLHATPDLTPEDQAAMAYLEQVHAFSEKRRSLLRALKGARTHNRMRLALGILDLLGAATALEQMASTTGGAMSGIALGLSTEHQGLWAGLSHNVFESAAVIGDGAELQVEAGHVAGKKGGRGFKDTLRKLFKRHPANPL